MLKDSVIAARAIFVSGLTAAALALGSPSFADAPPPLRPRPVSFPDGAFTNAAIGNVRATLASSLERGLPSVPLDDWLFLTLASHVQIPRTQIAAWGMTPCDDPASPVPGAGPDFCIEASVQLTAEKTVHVVIVAGEFRRSANGTERWVRTSPSLRDVFVENKIEGAAPDSLDVATLGEIEQAIQLSPDQWPSVDLQPSITWSPATPGPGAEVQLTIEVANKGKRSIERAFVRIQIWPCCLNKEISEDWFPRIDAASSVRTTVSLTLPNGWAHVIVSARPGPTNKRMRDPNPARPPTTAVIGQPY